MAILVLAIVLINKSQSLPHNNHEPTYGTFWGPPALSHRWNYLVLLQKLSQLKASLGKFQRRSCQESDPREGENVLVRG